MRGFVSRFLQVDGGRAFLVRVPGSANSALTDPDLAEVLNWMLATVDPGHLPDAFVPFDATEVGRLRREPLEDVSGTRATLVSRMAQTP